MIGSVGMELGSCNFERIGQGKPPWKYNIFLKMKQAREQPCGGLGEEQFRQREQGYIEALRSELKCVSNSKWPVCLVMGREQKEAWCKNESENKQISHAEPCKPWHQMTFT